MSSGNSGLPSGDDSSWYDSDIQKIARQNFNMDNDDDWDMKFFGASQQSVTKLSQQAKASLAKDVLPAAAPAFGDGAIRSRESQRTSNAEALPEPLTIKRTVRMDSSKPLDPLRTVSVSEAIRRILLGQCYSLESFRSKHEKLSLLQEAVGTQDGNVITAVLLFLKATLNTSLFHQELFCNVTASSHYIQYLRLRGSKAELVDLLGMLGRNEEAALTKYEMAVSQRKPEAEITSLKTSLRTHFATDPAFLFEKRQIEDQINLMERQIPIDDSDKREAAEGKLDVFMEIPREGSILSLPVITTLYYCCLYHYDLKESLLASPIALRNVFRLTEAQFVWTALSARSRLQRWEDIEELLITKKSWYTTVKHKSSIPFHRAVELLHKNNIPLEHLERHIRLVDGADRRLQLAKKYRCHKLVVDILVTMRDRQQLLHYKSTLPAQSRESLYLQEQLASLNVKWKN